MLDDLKQTRKSAWRKRLKLCISWQRFVLMVTRDFGCDQGRLLRFRHADAQVAQIKVEDARTLANTQEKESGSGDREGHYDLGLGT